MSSAVFPDFFRLFSLLEQTQMDRKQSSFLPKRNFALSRDQNFLRLFRFLSLMSLANIPNICLVNGSQTNIKNEIQEFFSLSVIDKRLP